MDRLTRSTADLFDLLRVLEGKGVELKLLEQPLDTRMAVGKAFFGVVVIFAEFEHGTRKERQIEGIQAAKAKGDVYK